MDVLNSTQLKQYLLLGFIIGLTVLLATYLYAFFPGLLGALTFYILMRQWFFKLTVVYNWKKWATAVLFIVLALLLFVAPIVFVGALLMPKVLYLLHHPNQLSQGLGAITYRLQGWIPQLRFDQDQIQGLMQKATTTVPSFLGATANFITNLILCFFLLYFMLIDGRKLERRIQDFMPLKDENIDDIWQATRTMVVSNAIGIPLLALFQAIVAGFGYFLFGVDEWVLWGVVTGLFSMLPVLGTAIIWAPLVVYLIATGHTSAGLGLLAFSLVVTINIDNVLRFTLLKRLGDVHPIITVLGIIVGIPIFGFMGLIFGPLLISYLLVLIRIYLVEFSPRRPPTRPKPL